MRVGACDYGQPLCCRELLLHLPLVAFSRLRQYIQFGLVGTEGRPELSFVHEHAVRIQIGAVNLEMLDASGPRDSKSDKTLPNAGGEQSTDDCR